jgi:hypothetical protein
MKIGDVVRLKGGSQKMTVINCWEGPNPRKEELAAKYGFAEEDFWQGTAHTAWHTEAGQPCHEIYPIESLEACKP